MPIDYTKDFMNAAERNSLLQVQPASIVGGGKGLVRGGGYVGVSFLPQRPIGGMIGRMGYGARCAPIFKGDLYQNGGNKKDEKCDCETKLQNSELSNLFNMQYDGMRGGALITQFSALYQVAPIFASMSINKIIAIIMLIFGHSYAIKYGDTKISNMSKKSHKSRLMKGGGVSIFTQILAPLGMNNLVAIAGLLLLHYFAVKNIKMGSMSGGNKFNSSINASIFENEIKIQEMLGGNKIYEELRNIFLGKNNDKIIGGKKKSKLERAIAPINKDKYIAFGLMSLLKKLFTNFYYTIYKNNKKSASYYSNNTYIFFKKIFDVMAPVSVALYLKKNNKNNKNKVKK